MRLMLIHPLVQLLVQARMHTLYRRAADADYPPSGPEITGFSVGSPG